ncbi:MAG: hypothetical protein ABI950_04675 [Solirubrobacteraceae bacterium]
MTPIRGERGEMSLPGLLVAMTLFLVVLGATLSLFAMSETNNRDTQRRNDAMDRVRSGVDVLSREMRNMASPTPEQPQAIDRASGRDVIFQTVDPVGPNTGTGTNINTANVKRVRYCLDDSGVLWAQNQRWKNLPPQAPLDTLCPGTVSSANSTWNDKTVISDQLTNYLAGHSRPLFTFSPALPLTAITSVHIDAFVDLDTGRNPAETTISSGVFLRNQNRAPSAAFTATASAQGLILNASNSVDPEGEPLTYCWYDAALVNVTAPPAPCAAGKVLGTGVTILDPMPSGSTAHSITLVVRDPALLSASNNNPSVRNQ